MDARVKPGHDQSLIQRFWKKHAGRVGCDTRPAARPTFPFQAAIAMMA
jgi:hypothetical protein